MARLVKQLLTLKLSLQQTKICDAAMQNGIDIERREYEDQKDEMIFW